MPEIRSRAVEQPTPAGLISFLKAIPSSRHRRGVSYPQWFLLLLAVLGIYCLQKADHYSGSGSFRDFDAFAKRHREGLNQAPGREAGYSGGHKYCICLAERYLPSLNGFNIAYSKSASKLLTPELTSLATLSEEQMKTFLEPSLR